MVGGGRVGGGWRVADGGWWVMGGGWVVGGGVVGVEWVCGGWWVVGWSMPTSIDEQCVDDSLRGGCHHP